MYSSIFTPVDSGRLSKTIKIKHGEQIKLFGLTENVLGLLRGTDGLSKTFELVFTNDVDKYAGLYVEEGFAALYADNAAIAVELYDTLIDIYGAPVRLKNGLFAGTDFPLEVRSLDNSSKLIITVEDSSAVPDVSAVMDMLFSGFGTASEKKLNIKSCQLFLPDADASEGGVLPRSINDTLYDAIGLAATAETNANAYTDAAVSKKFGKGSISTSFADGESATKTAFTASLPAGFLGANGWFELEFNGYMDSGFTSFILETYVGGVKIHESALLSTLVGGSNEGGWYRVFFQNTGALNTNVVKPFEFDFGYVIAKGAGGPNPWNTSFSIDTSAAVDVEIKIVGVNAAGAARSVHLKNVTFTANKAT